jgi:hypothetical protein
MGLKNAAINGRKAVMAKSQLKYGQFTIGGTKPGEPTLKGMLLVAGSGDVVGAAVFSWAVSPPQRFAVTLSGQTHATGLGTAKQLYALHGHAFPAMAGASNIPMLSIVLDGIWGKKGTASFTVWNDTPDIKTFENLSIAVNWLD